MKLPRIDLACLIDDYRPVYGYINVTKDFIYATNAHIIVRHKTQEVFKDIFIETIPDKGMLIPANAWKLARNKKTVRIALTDDKLKIELYQEDSSIITYGLGNHLTFIDCESVMPKKEECSELKEIGLTPRILNLLSESMECSTLKIQFYGAAKAMLCLPNQSLNTYFGVIGICMPCMILDEY
jgi:hypothetical protein